MNSPTIGCPNCKVPIEWQYFNTPVMTKCPACNTPLQVEIFPAFFEKSSLAVKSNPPAVENESGCFFHPQKKAVVACALCGRFLCSLCDIEFGGQHVCPTCFEAGKKKRKIMDLETHRVLYDDIALALAIIPTILVWPTIATAPASIYMSIRYWKAPTSIIPRTKIRFVVAIAISLLQVTGWFFLISYLATVYE